MSKLLTPLELKVMNILWRLKEAFVKEIISEWPDEKTPAYNTISTTVRILQEKEFVDHKAFGRTHQYFPVVTKTAYQGKLIKNVLENAFSGSTSNLVSALMGDKKISDSELKEIRNIIDNSK